MNYEQIEISKINRAAYNPRRVFDDSKIAELAHNIREQGKVTKWDLADASGWKLDDVEINIIKK